MSLLMHLGLSLVAGVALGSAYFLALWTSAGCLTQSRRAGTWLALGLLARLALTGTAFVLLARWGAWPALATALVGFLIARTLCVRAARQAAPGPAGASIRADSGSES